MPIAVPEWVLTREFDAEREQVVDSQFALADFWTEELKRIDPHLSVVWTKPSAAAAGLEPERWHIRRENPETLDSYFPLVGDNGEYREPGQWMLHELEAGDLWNPRVHRDREDARRRLREVKRRAKARETEQRRDEMALAARAARRMKGESGFTKRNDLKGKPTEHSV